MNVVDILRTTPATVRRIEEDIIREKEEVARLKMRSRFLQADALEQVSKLTVDGKKVYPNAEARESAARVSLQNNPDWKAIQDKLEGIENLVAKMEATIRYHQDLQKNARVLVLGRSPFDLILDEAPGGAA